MLRYKDSRGEVSITELEQTRVNLPEECGMSDSLSVCCDEIMLFIRHVDISRLKGLENVLDQCQSFIRPAMLDQNLHDPNPTDPPHQSVKA